MDIQLFLAALPGVPNVPSAGVAGVSKMYLLTNCPPMPAAQWVAYVGLARGGWGSYLRRRRTEVNIRIGQLSSELLLDESDRGHPGSLGLVEERGDEQARDPDEANEEARLEHAASCDRHLSRALDLPGHIRAAQRTGERANGSKEARTSPRILPPTPMAAMVSPLTESAAPGLPESSRRQASRDSGALERASGRGMWSALFFDLARRPWPPSPRRPLASQKRPLCSLRGNHKLGALGFVSALIILRKIDT